MAESLNSMQDYMHVVLVEPADNLNIGAVARAMMNFGFKHLHLVNPKAFSPAGAKITARAASKLFDHIKIHHSFETAMQDMQEIVGFSCYQGERYFGQLLLGDWLEKHTAAPFPRTALVFGPEDSGLRSEHFAHCRWIVRIPTSDEFSALNLAQSVLLVLFELSRLTWGNLSTGSSPAPATEAQYQNLDRLLDDLMLKLNIVQRQRKSPVPGRLKNLLRRSCADSREIKLLLTLFGRISRRLKFER